MTALTRIALHGVPRSGTSWLGEVLNSAPQVIYRYQPLFSYAFKDYLTPTSTEQDIDRFFDGIAASDDEFLTQEEQRVAGHMPRFDKTVPSHVIYKEVRYHHLPETMLRQTPDLKFIFLVRDPRAVMASWLRAGREFRHDLGWDVAQEWRAAPSKNAGRPEEFYGFERWKEATLVFMDLAACYPDRVHLLSYSDLLAAPEQNIEMLFDFCGLPFGPQSRDFVVGRVKGAQDSDYSVFRDRRLRDDGWHAHLPDDIARAINDDLAGTVLARFLQG